VDLQVVDQVAELGAWVAEAAWWCSAARAVDGLGDSRLPGPSGSARRGTPMTYQAFTRDPVARRRYWARSHLGWRTIGDARPNDGHRAVARLQELGLVGGIITQNVDGLHQAAGGRNVVELHGNLAGSPASAAAS